MVTKARLVVVSETIETMSYIFKNTVLSIQRFKNVYSPLYPLPLRKST